VDFAAGLADAVDQVGEFVALGGRDAVGADGVGRDEGGRPAAGPALAHGRDLDPIGAAGELAGILGLDGAVGDRATLLGRELAELLAGLGADAVGDRDAVT